MAAPNIVGPTSILGKTAFSATSVTGATGTVLLNNAASSGKVLQVTALYVSNVDVTNCEITVKVHNQDDGGGEGRALCSRVTVPANATLMVVTKDSALWLEEDRSVVVSWSATDDLEFVCSYLEIS